MDTSPNIPFSRSDPGELKGSARKKTATMAGVLHTIRREESYHHSVLSPAAFSDSDNEEVINSTCTTCVTFTTQVVFRTEQEEPSLTVSLPDTGSLAPPSSSPPASPGEDEPETLEESCTVGTVCFCYSTPMQETGELDAPQVSSPPPARSPGSLAVAPSTSAPSASTPSASTPSASTPSASTPSPAAEESSSKRRRRSGREGEEGEEEAGSCSQCHVPLSTRKIRSDSAVQYRYRYRYSTVQYSGVQYAVH
jgi:hypothetical protein